MTLRTLLLLAIGAALAVLAGCNAPGDLGVNPAPGGAGATLDAALQGVVRADETADPNAAGINADDELAEQTPAVFAGPVSAGPAPLSILPDSAQVRWWRTLTGTRFDLQASGASDSVLVSAQRANTGLFHGELLVSRRPGGRRDSALYAKPFAVTWTHRAVYRKSATGLGDGEEGTRWVLRSLTVAKAMQTSPPGPVPAIVSAQLTDLRTGASFTFTDPDRMFDPQSLPRFEVGDSIRVKLVTDGSGATRLAYVHFDVEAHDKGRAWRRPLAYVPGDGAFEGSFRVREGFGGRHVGLLRTRSAAWVDVLTRSSVYDTDPAQYGAAGWGLPYRVSRHQGVVAVNRP